LAEVIKAVSETGATVLGCTADGTQVNVTTFQLFGAKFDDGPAWFQNPANATEKIYVFLNAVHMLKLVRNTLGDTKILLSNDGLIKCRYLEDLQKIQDLAGLRAANKLRADHIFYRRQK